MNQQELIRRVAAALESDRRVLALFLAGSFGKGSADAYSDIDFLAVTEPEARESFLSSWPRILEEITHVVLWNHSVHGPSLVNAITAEWVRCDLLVVDRTELTKRSQESLKALIDRADLFALLPLRAKRASPNPARISSLIHEFLRVLGLLAVVAGRGEYVVGVTDAGILRSHLINLMLEESEVNDTGALHLSRVLSEEQMKILYALPAPAASLSSVVDAHIACARVFLPHAKIMAGRLNIAWPDEFEAATLWFLKKELGIEI